MLGSLYNFGFTFNMPTQLESEKYQTWRVLENDHFTIKLPELAGPGVELSFGKEGLTSQLILKDFNESGTLVDYAIVTFKDNNEMYIEMLPGVEQMDFKGGFVTLEGMFSLSDETGVGDIEIRNPFNEETTYILKNPSTIDGLQVNKTFVDYNLDGETGVMKWEVAVNRNYKHYDSLTLTDTPPANHTFKGDPKVYSVAYNSAGVLVPNSKTLVLPSPDTFSIDPLTKVITFKDIQTPYLVEYETEFSYGDNRPTDPNIDTVTMENKVVLSDGIKEVSSSAKHDVKYKKRLVKSAGDYDPETRRVTWTVDYGTPPLTLNKTTLVDTLPKEMILLEGTLSIIHHPNAPSLEGAVTYISGTDFKLKYNEGDPNFEIELLKDTTGKLKISYETQVNEDYEITENITFINEITEKDGGATSGRIGIPQINQ